MKINQIGKNKLKKQKKKKRKKKYMETGEDLYMQWKPATEIRARLMKWYLLLFPMFILDFLFYK